MEEEDEPIYLFKLAEKPEPERVQKRIKRNPVKEDPPAPGIENRIQEPAVVVAAPEVDKESPTAPAVDKEPPVAPAVEKESPTAPVVDKESPTAPAVDKELPTAPAVRRSPRRLKKRHIAQLKKPNADKIILTSTASAQSHKTAVTPQLSQVETKKSSASKLGRQAKGDGALAASSSSSKPDAPGGKEQPTGDMEIDSLGGPHCQQQ